MVQFTATIAQFAAQGEKTGWTYIVVPADVAEQMNPGVRKSYRVKGKLDAHPIKSVAILPMGGGEFIMPLNAAMRRAIHKKKGAMVKVQLQIDQAPLELPPGFMECLDDEPKAKKAFDALKLSHRNYFIKWMGGVKGEAARAKRCLLYTSSKDGYLLFICDGRDGLKLFNAGDPYNLSLLSQVKGFQPTDVIALGGIAIVTAKDGLYCIDYSDVNNAKIASKIPVIQNN